MLDTCTVLQRAVSSQSVLDVIVAHMESDQTQLPRLAMCFVISLSKPALLLSFAV